MSDTNISYNTYAIDTELLNVYDITEAGKVVTAEVWVALWNLVFRSINGIDAFCSSIEQVRLNWAASEKELKDITAQFNVKYDALSKSFVHYGDDEPNNEHIKFWVQPVANVHPQLVVTHEELANTNGIRTPLKDNPSFALYRPELLNESSYIVEQYHAVEPITGIRFGGNVAINNPYIIPAGANITVVYSRGMDIVSAGVTTYSARVTLFLDTSWLIEPGTVQSPAMVTACEGYYAVDFEVVANAVSAASVKRRFYKSADETIARTVTITLNKDAWIRDQNAYYQILNISDLTYNSKIDLTPTPIQLNTFYSAGTSFVIENAYGTVKAWCIGSKPVETYAIPATITEVTVQ